MDYFCLSFGNNTNSDEVSVQFKYLDRYWRFNRGV